MANVLQVVQACKVTVVGYPEYTFAKGDQVNPNHPAYRQLQWSGLATDTGVAGPETPVPTPPKTLQYYGNPTDNQVLVWQASSSSWVPAAGSGGISQAQLDAQLGDYVPRVGAPVRDIPGLYVPGRDPAGNAWGSALLSKLTGGGLGVLAGHGDSLMHGMFATSLRTTAWWPLLVSELQAKWGDGGSGFFGGAMSRPVLTSLGLSASRQNAWDTAGDLWQTTGSWLTAGGVQNGQGVGNCALCSNVVGDVASTPPSAVRGRYIDILHNSTAAYSFTYSIDNGGAVTVNAAAGHNITTVDTGSSASATHAVTLTMVSFTSGTFVAFGGVRGRNTSGLIGDRYAVYGHQTNRWNNADTGKSASRSGGANSAHASMRADLLIYALGGNDGAQATPVTGDTLMNNVQADLTGMNSSLFGGTAANLDVALLMNFVGKYDGTAQNGIVAPQRANYSARLSSFARTSGCAMIDMNPVFRSWDYARAQGYLDGGTSTTEIVHLSDAGSIAQEQQVRKLFVAAGLL